MRLDPTNLNEKINQWGKTSLGWLFGFKLHLIINDRGNLMGVCFTPGGVYHHGIVLLIAKGFLEIVATSATNYSNSCGFKESN